MQPLQIRKTNTILYCKSFRETVQFYREQLTLPVTLQTEWLVEFQLTPESFLSIADSARSSIDDVAGQGVTASWQVRELEMARAWLQAREISLSPVEIRLGGKVFFFRDPEGHRIEIWQCLAGGQES